MVPPNSGPASTASSAPRTRGDGPTESAAGVCAPQRNSRRDGGTWSKSVGRTVLTSLRYTGHQVWNRQRKVEQLIDVDVALDHQTRQTCNTQDVWIASEKQTHTPLISLSVFTQAQDERAARGQRTNHEPTCTPHPYAFTGVLVRCSWDRRMHGIRNHGRAYLRCRCSKEYALANGINHPSTVDLREDALIEPVDHRVSGVLAHDRIDESLAVTADAQTVPDPRPGTADHQGMRRQAGPLPSRPGSRHRPRHCRRLDPRDEDAAGHRRGRADLERRVARASASATEPRGDP